MYKIKTVCDFDWNHNKNIDELLENTLFMYFSKIYGKDGLFFFSRK